MSIPATSAIERSMANTYGLPRWRCLDMLNRMKRAHALILILILLVSVAGGALALYIQRAPADPTFSVAQARALLARHRRTWGGRVIRIRGTVTTTQETFPCARPSCALVGIADSIDDAPALTLWLGQEADNPFWAAIRRVPVVGLIAPSRQQPIVARPATYHIRLLAHPNCSGMRCYDAVLLDSQPPAPPAARTPGPGGATATPGAHH
jgi:hypothetical protein